MKPKILLSLPDNGGKNYINAFSHHWFDIRADYLTKDIYCDALVLCGGGDVAPEYYGEMPCGSHIPDIYRDKTEMYLFEKYYTLKKPIFGICRGAQLINIAMGGTLFQDMPNAKEHKYDGKDQYHEVVNVEGTAAHSLFGEKTIVNSAHHQSLKRIASGLYVMQKHKDGTDEGIYGENIIGLQWHPERLPKGEGMAEASLIFEYFEKLILQN